MRNRAVLNTLFLSTAFFFTSCYQNDTVDSVDTTDSATHENGTGIFETESSIPTDFNTDDIAGDSASHPPVPDTEPNLDTTTESMTENVSAPDTATSVNIEDSASGDTETMTTNEVGSDTESETETQSTDTSSDVACLIDTDQVGTWSLYGQTEEGNPDELHWELNMDGTAREYYSAQDTEGVVIDDWSYNYYWCTAENVRRLHMYNADGSEYSETSKQIIFEDQLTWDNGLLFINGLLRFRTMENSDTWRQTGLFETLNWDHTGDHYKGTHVRELIIYDEVGTEKEGDYHFTYTDWLESETGSKKTRSHIWGYAFWNGNKVAFDGNDGNMYYGCYHEEQDFMEWFGVPNMDFQCSVYGFQKE